MTEEIAVREINSDARPALKDREIDEKTLESQYSEVWQRKLEVENDAPPKLMVDSLSGCWTSRVWLYDGMLVDCPWKEADCSNALGQSRWPSSRRSSHTWRGGALADNPWISLTHPLKQLLVIPKWYTGNEAFPHCNLMFFHGNQNFSLS